MNQTITQISLIMLNLIIAVVGIRYLIPILSEPVQGISPQETTSEALVMEVNAISGAKYNLTSSLCSIFKPHTQTMVINTGGSSDNYSETLNQLSKSEAIDRQVGIIKPNSPNYPQFSSELSLGGYDTFENQSVSLVIHTDDCNLRINRSERYVQ